jgi:hypothetical protein
VQFAGAQVGTVRVGDAGYRLDGRLEDVRNRTLGAPTVPVKIEFQEYAGALTLVLCMQD